MAVLTEFFAATPDELESLAIEWGPVPPPPQPPKAKGGLFGFGKKQPIQEEPVKPLGPTLPAVQSTGILDTQVGALDSVVTGAPYLGASDPIAEGDAENGPWVFRIRRELRDGLAKLDDSQVSDIAQRWGENEEFAAKDAEEFEALEDLVRELVGLSRTASDTSRDLYLWASL